MSKPLPPLELLRDLFLYDPETGVVTRRKTIQGRGSIKGAIVGTPNDCGHLICRVNYQICYVHRIAWKMHYGTEPPPIVDHINGAETDNRIANMRAATNRQNGMNRKASRGSHSGIKGAHWSTRAQKWRSSIKSGDKKIHLGWFDTKEQAAAAYAVAAPIYHGKFARAA